MRPFRLIFGSLGGVAFLLTVTLAVSGGASGEEPFFPRAGNRGYDALEYKVSLHYSARSGEIESSTRMDAVATRSLARFSLDLFGLQVDEVRVQGQLAKIARGRGKLKVTPAHPLAPDMPFSVMVRYHGRPRTITDPDGSQEGWYPTDDGVLAVGEPQGTAAWIPCDNVPADKARFAFEVLVPKGLKAVANGTLQGRQEHGGGVRWRWREEAPMSTYLAVLDIGRGQLTEGSIGNHPTWTFVDPRLAKASRRALAKLPEVIHFESEIFGHYPVPAAGSIVDFAPKLGYALESQSRPIYAFAPDLTTVVHETAHQWFGDSVGLKRWPNIWLNEGFATWTEWFYAERHGGRSAHAIFNRLYRVPASNRQFWEPPSAHPGTPKNLFGTSTYVRGGMALEALRLKIGTKPMLRVLRTWVIQHRYGSGDIKEFIALAEKISGRPLGRLFHRWLYKRGKP